MAVYFAVVAFYPLVSVIILRLMGIDDQLTAQIINEYSLLIYYTVAYAGIIILFFFGTKGIFNALIAFIIYTIGYFALSITRKLVYTDSKEDTIATT